MTPFGTPVLPEVKNICTGVVRDGGGISISCTRIASMSNSESVITLECSNFALSFSFTIHILLKFEWFDYSTEWIEVREGYVTLVWTL